MNETPFANPIHDLLIAIVATALIGCGSPSTSPEATHPPTIEPADPRVTITDPDLRDQLEVGPINVARDASQLLQITAPIRSKSNLAIYISWRVAWQDANGIPLGQPSAWSTAIIPSDEPRELTATSWTSRAARVQIEVRHAR